MPYRQVREKQWLPPSPVLGSKRILCDILGSLFHDATLEHVIETEGSEEITTEGGQQIEKEH